MFLWCTYVLVGSKEVMGSRKSSLILSGMTCGFCPKRMRE